MGFLGLETRNVPNVERGIYKSKNLGHYGSQSLYF